MLRQNCKRAHIQRFKDLRLTIKRDEDQGLVLSEKVWTSPSYRPQCLVGQGAMFYERSVQRCRRVNDL